jgi:hypothetical protein
MDAASVYATRVSANEYLHPHAYHRAPSPTTSLSPTLVNDALFTERPSHNLTIPCGASNILNSVVVNSAGQSLYSISSDSKHTTLVSCSDNVEVATVQWDRSSPRMVLRRKKMKCKAWLPLIGTENEYVPAPRQPLMSSRIESERDPARSRMFTHDEVQFTWVHGSASGHVRICSPGCPLRGLIDSSQLIPVNRPGVAVAQWHIRPRSDELILDIFQETLVESGLLEAIVFSVVLLRSGRSLGDSPDLLSLSNHVQFLGGRGF